MPIIRIISIILVGLLLIFSTLRVLAAGLALAQGTSDRGIGFFLGTLIVELVLLAIFIRLFRRLRTPR